MVRLLLLRVSYEQIRFAFTYMCVRMHVYVCECWGHCVKVCTLIGADYLRMEKLSKLSGLIYCYLCELQK